MSDFNSLINSLFANMQQGDESATGDEKMVEDLLNANKPNVVDGLKNILDGLDESIQRTFSNDVSPNPKDALDKLLQGLESSIVEGFKKSKPKKNKTVKKDRIVPNVNYLSDINGILAKIKASSKVIDLNLKKVESNKRLMEHNERIIEENKKRVAEVDVELAVREQHLKDLIVVCNSKLTSTSGDV